MALGVLNNISAISAQNNLSNTQASLSKVLQQLSSGSRINSGADDAAGLSLANGLQASSTALTQSAANASEGVDFLQVADGALSQVTSLLNRAITLATEASNGTLNGSQVSAANSEYQKILTETDTINNNTEYNGISTFAKSSAFTVSGASDAVNVGASGNGTMTVSLGTQKFLIAGTAAGAPTPGTGIQLTSSSTISTIADAINNGLGATVATVQGNQLVLSGGAKLTASTQPTIAVGTGSLTAQGANDIVGPGAAGLTITDSTGGNSVAVGGAWAAGQAGGNLAALANAINTNASLDSGANQVTAKVTGNTITLTGTGTYAATTGPKFADTNALTDTGIPQVDDSVTVPLTSAGGISTLSVGNANDTLTANTGALQFTTTGGSAMNINNFGAGQGGNLATLAAQITTQFGTSGVTAIVSGNTLKLTGGQLSQASGSVTETETPNTISNQSVAIFTSDGTISQSYNNSASDLVQASSTALSLAGTDLTTTGGAQAALVAINNAITSVAADRGTIGANINTLTAVENVMTTQSTNTLAAENDVTATDYGQATSDMSKYQILSQTGIAALSQANQSQQLITKLLQ
jgi:flagellin